MLSDISSPWFVGSSFSGNLLSYHVSPEILSCYSFLCDSILSVSKIKTIEIQPTVQRDVQMMISFFMISFFRPVVFSLMLLFMDCNGLACKKKTKKKTRDGWIPVKTFLRSYLTSLSYFSLLIRVLHQISFPFLFFLNFGRVSNKNPANVTEDKSC